MSESPRPARARCTHVEREPVWGGALWRCRGCGLVGTRKPPQLDYGPGYFLGTGDAFGYDFGSPLAEAMDAARFEGELERLESQGLRGTVLDVGCGTGGFLVRAQRRGWQVDGIEASDYARAQAGERLGVEIHASLDTLPQGRRFDLVTLHHVLEHLADPVSFLEDAVRPRVRERLLIEVPNFASLGARVEGPGWKDLRLEQHAVHFEPASLRRTVSDAGFRVLRVYSLGEALWSLRAALRMLGLLRGLLYRRQHRVAAGSSPPPVAESTFGYSPARGLRRLLASLSRLALLPLTRGLERLALAERLVLEATHAVEGDEVCR